MAPLLAILMRNRKAAVGLAIVLAYALIAILAPLIADDPMRRVGRPHEAPSVEHLLGTTRMGRDVFAQLIWGTRTSLVVGLTAGLIVTVLGVAIGVTAGYLGGWVDEALNLLTNIVLVIPQLPLLLVLAAFIGQASPLVIALIIGITSWGWGARVTRAQTLSLRQRDFVQAAELIGEPAWRMIAIELMPNLLSIIGFNFIGSVIYTIITEATLEFLGLGDPLAVSWGTMLYNAQTASAITVGAWWEVFAPCLAIAVIGIGLSLLNFGVDEISNPRLRTLGAIGRAVRIQRLLDRSRALAHRRGRAMTGSGPLVDVRGLRVDYLTTDGAFTAVKGVDLTIGRGEVLGLAGESGCGKSTLAYALMRLHRPPAFIVEGRIAIDGRDVLALDPAALSAWRWRTASFVFQSAMNALNPVLTVFEQFRDVIVRHTGATRAEARARAAEQMRLVGIPEARLDDYPHQLSGGMRQRVVLAIALALEPKLVIMDEPTTALDVVVQREILQEILVLKARLGFSILFITHDLALMAQIADRIAIMLAGRIVEVAATDDIVHRPQHAYTRRLWAAMPRLEAGATA